MAGAVVAARGVRVVGQRDVRRSNGAGGGHVGRDGEAARGRGRVRGAGDEGDGEGGGGHGGGGDGDLRGAAHRMSFRSEEYARNGTVPGLGGVTQSTPGARTRPVQALEIRGCKWMSLDDFRHSSGALFAAPGQAKSPRRVRPTGAGARKPAAMWEAAPDWRAPGCGLTSTRDPRPRRALSRVPSPPASRRARPPARSRRLDSPSAPTTSPPRRPSTSRGRWSSAATSRPP